MTWLMSLGWFVAGFLAAAGVGLWRVVRARDTKPLPLLSFHVGVQHSECVVTLEADCKGMSLPTVAIPMDEAVRLADHLDEAVHRLGKAA